MAVSTGAEWWRPVAIPRAVPSRVAAGSWQDSPVPFGTLMVFTFILLLSPQTFIPELARVRIALLTGAFAVAAHCWTRLMARRPLMRITPEIGLATGLLGWAIATIPLSEWPGGSVQVLGDLYLKTLIIFWLLCNTITTLGRLRTVAWGLSLMAAPLAATGVWNFFSQRELAGRILGYDAPLTQNPNDLALMLNLILPLTIALFLISHRPVLRSIVAGLIVLDAGAIVVTFSRAGFLTLAMIFLLYIRTLHRWRQRKWAVAGLVLVVAALPLLPAGYTNRLATIANINADETGSAQIRWGDTRTALSFALDHPLTGAGLGMNILALNDLRGPKWIAVHNAYLEYAMDLGWPGLALFLLLFVSCLRTVARVRSWCAGRLALQELAVLTEAVWITLMAFAVAALFSPVAYNFYFFYFAALAVASATVYESEMNAIPGTLAPRGTR